jgi:hypothetical protein
MPPIARSVRLAPTPDAKPIHPWRFALGQTVYALGWPSTENFTIVGGELWLGFPHLHVLDRDGKTWRLPQLHCASKPPASLKA